MGNWRTVQITGTMTAADAGALRRHLGYSHHPAAAGYARDAAWDHFGPLSFSRDQPSLCGINDWPAPQVSRSGNLAERGYSPEDVRGQLQELLAVAPSMMLVIHCGADWEELDCVATIRCGDGVAALLPPEVATIEGMSDGQAALNVIRALSGGY